MITSIQDYNSKLHLIYSQNPPTFALLPANEPIYDINITTRSISAPEFLGVEKDHQAETVYFRIDRFVDYMDLTSTACIITYINANGEAGMHIPKFYDVITEQKDNKILIPWTLDQKVMKKSGTIVFSVRFFKTKLEQSQDQLELKPIIVYELNLLPAQTKVLKGIDIQNDIIKEETTLSAGWLEELQNQITELKASNQLTWTIIDE